MSIKDNYLKALEIRDKLEKTLPVKLGINKLNELVRLIFEISEAEGKCPDEVLLNAGTAIFEEDKGGLFHRIKQELLIMRYPSREEDSNIRIMPLKLKEGREECSLWDGELAPKHIFVEREAALSGWTKNFLEQFPFIAVEEMGNIHKTVKKLALGDSVDEYNNRRDNILITKNKASFIKICPCTKAAARCGYWILNLGFGCPFDCSYCYLQTYSDIPGLILTSNIEDYYEHILEFDNVSEKGRRIGTGEFTDSLALDKYTGYSKYLISFFRKTKNLILELKTKTADIDNVLKEEPHQNVVISWSINTQGAAELYEKGAASISQRINAALHAAKRGYRVAFHFDPVIWHENWEKEYEDVIRELFSHKEIKEKTAWISLGTLRYTPGLKQTAEQRFGENLCFYKGEFFLDFDEKFRYPENLRSEIYSKMSSFIRKTGISCWIYLCMEPKKMQIDSSSETSR